MNGRNSDADSRRICILVLGMHRSGTSALTRIISLLGAELPKDMLGANLGNVAGHWEPERLIALHDKMLAEAGSRWDDWRAFDPDALDKERLDHYKNEIIQIIADEYGQAPLFVLKEPRIARFAPLYAGVLGAMGVDVRYVLTNRNPLAVAASLGRRDGFTNGFADLLWLRHALDAEHATRSGPRVFISYEDLLADWRQVIDPITGTLGIGWPRAIAEASSDIESHVSADHQHYAASAEGLFQDKRTAAWVKDAYSALKALETDPADSQAMATLDRVKAEFNAVPPIFGEAFFPELRVRQQIFDEKEGRQRQLAEERAAEIARLSAESEQKTAESAALEAQVVRMAENDAKIAAQAKSSERLRQKIFDKTEGRRQQLAEERATEIALLSVESERKTDEMVAREAQLIQIVAESETRLAAQAQYVSESSERLETLANCVAELNTRIAAMQNSKSWRLTGSARFAARIYRDQKFRSDFLLGLRKWAVKASPCDLVRLRSSARRILIRLRSRELYFRPFWLRIKRAFKFAADNRSPITDSSNRRTDAELIRESGFFDFSWYLEQTKSRGLNGLDPIEHYCAHGVRLALDPTREFSTSGYLEAYPDVRSRGTNPLTHYLRHGRSEGRSPNPFATRSGTATTGLERFGTRVRTQ